VNTELPQDEQKKSSSLGIRLLSGIILAPLTLALIYLGGWYFISMVVVASAVALYEWYVLARGGPHRLLVMGVGIVYLTICFGSFVYLRQEFHHGAWLALMIIVAVWASDTGAYIVGKICKGPKLAPRTSPKKTWSGFAGAMIFCGLGLYGMALLGPTELIAKNSLIYFPLGCVLGAIGQIGDLFISWFKRRIGIKDISKLIPGHGGLLDRIDALLLVSPTFLTALQMWLE
jgi:phosphatidate cytidylyltransferase